MTFAGDDNPMSLLMLSMMGAFAEFERSITNPGSQRESRRPRRSLASTQDVNLLSAPPRPASFVPVPRLERKDTLAAEYGISRETLYAYLRAGSAA